MKKLFIPLFFATTLILSAWGVEKPFAENTRPSRKIHVDNKTLLELNKGNNNIEIILDKKAYKSTRFAAEELQKFLSRQLGVNIPIVNTPTQGKISFFVGINQFSRNAKIQDSTLCRDAFIIKTIGKNIYILGRDAQRDTRLVVEGKQSGLQHEHATLFGVYEFLERFCGIRFYHGDDLFTIVPELKKITIPQIDIYDRPDFEARSFTTFAGKVEDDHSRRTWAPYVHFASSKALNHLRFRCETISIPNCHGLYRLFYLERFAKSNPEYFALQANGSRHNNPEMDLPGQLCYSSGIMNEIFEDAKAILSGDMKKIKARSSYLVNKHGGFTSSSGHTPGFVFNFMPPDGYYHCRCKKCLPHMKSDQDISNFVWGKAVELANKLKAAGVNGYVSTMAYTPCQILPTNVQLPENMIVMVAQNGPWDPENVQASNKKKIEDWNRNSKVNKVWLWNYACKVRSRNLVLPGVPSGTPRAVGNYYKSLKGKINGAYLESECSYPGDHYAITALNLYLFGKLTWNNDADVNAIIDEYHKLCYGAAAPEMEKITNMIEKIWLTKIHGKTIMTNLGPMNIPPSDNVLWNEIYSQARLNEMEKILNQAATKVKNDAKALARINYFRKNVFLPLVKQSQLYIKRSDSISKFSLGLSPKKPAILFLQPLKANDKPFVQTKVTVKDLREKLEFTFNCSEPDMANIAAVNKKHDDSTMWQDNGVEIFLNPSGDKINYYQLIINSLGNISDAQGKKNGTKQSLDSKWNSGAVAKVSQLKDSWILVLTIEKSEFGKWNPAGFVANFNRNRVVNGKTEHFTWSPFLVNGFHDVEHFGNIVPAENIPENIVKNGSFEAKRWPAWGGWQKQFIKPGEIRDHDYNFFVFGDKSLKISYKGDNTKNLQGIGQTLYQLKPGKKYRISYFIKLENVVPFKRGGGARIRIWNSSKNFYFPVTGLTGTMPWTLQTFEFQSLNNSQPKTTSINCDLFFASGTAWFDGIRVEEME